jgi:tetratricopeptide (TPR) repeat protein
LPCLKCGGKVAIHASPSGDLPRRSQQPLDLPNFAPARVSLHSGSITSRPHEGQVWDTLGFAHHHLGHHAKAVACYRRAVQILDDHGYLYNKAVTLTWAGEAYRAAGDAQAAREAWRQALAILKATRHPDTARVLANLDDLATAAGLARQQTLGSLDGIGS